ncbi:MAG TPA: hypothetical protein VM260_24645 [Pirellula sp.]|nr:hypothetical protein [Pirellula sp.]
MKSEDRTVSNGSVKAERAKRAAGKKRTGLSGPLDDEKMEKTLHWKLSFQLGAPWAIQIYFFCIAVFALGCEIRLVANRLFVITAD